MEHAFAEMKSIAPPRAGGTEQQSEFVCVNGRTFQVPRGKAVEVPEPVYEVLENARRQLEAAQTDRRCDGRGLKKSGAGRRGRA